MNKFSKITGLIAFWTRVIAFFTTILVIIFQNTLSEPYNKYIQITSQRSGQPGVNAEEYKEYSVMCPPTLAEQQKIGQFFSKYDSLISAQQKEIDKLKDIKKSLLQKMFV